jgi:hypothetical protein
MKVVPTSSFRSQIKGNAPDMSMEYIPLPGQFAQSTSGFVEFYMYIFDQIDAAMNRQGTTWDYEIDANNDLRVYFNTHDDRVYFRFRYVPWENRNK